MLVKPARQGWFVIGVTWAAHLWLRLAGDVARQAQHRDHSRAAAQGGDEGRDPGGQRGADFGGWTVENATSGGSQTP